MHNDFTLFKRTYPNGTKVVFYHAYDENGKRVGPWTTHSRNLTAARARCNKLLKAGALIPGKNKAVTFAKFAEGFWDRNSEYVRRQESRADITESYLKSCRKNVTKQILPFFGSVFLDKITEKDVNIWLLAFKGRGGKKDENGNILGYKNTYANTALGTLNVMMAEAARRELIPFNPCASVKKLKNDPKKIEILTVEEAQKLFPKNYKTVWGDKEIPYAANRLASLTGMRIGETMGLRGEYVFDDYIYVCGQYGKFGYGATKNKENRYIPLLPEMIELLRKLTEKNGTGYVFSQDGGGAPVIRNYICKGLKQALNSIGITDAEIKRRGLTMHGWRHFLNTEMLQQGLTVEQAQGVTWHKSKRMTDRYNHPDARRISDITKAQAAIAGKEAEKPKDKAPKKEAKKTTGRAEFKIVKSRGEGNAANRKKAS